MTPVLRGILLVGLLILGSAATADDFRERYEELMKNYDDPASGPDPYSAEWWYCQQAG